MIQIVYRVVLATVWLVIGVGMLFCRDLLPAQMVAGRDAFFLNMMGMLALLLVAYNVMRLVNYLRRRAAQVKLDANPLARPRPEPQSPREQEYIPELDFTNNGPPAEVRADEEKPAGNEVTEPRSQPDHR